MPYQKKISQNYKGATCVSYKFKGIIVNVNDKTYIDICEPDKRCSLQNWLSISSNGLLYLSYTDGRLYFFKDKEDIQLSVDDVKKTLSFVYEGIWEKEKNGKYDKEKVEYPVTITFQEKDYVKLKKILKDSL